MRENEGHFPLSNPENREVSRIYTFGETDPGRWNMMSELWEQGSRGKVGREHSW